MQQSAGDDDLRNFADKIELQLRSEQQNIQNNGEHFSAQPDPSQPIPPPQDGGSQYPAVPAPKTDSGSCSFIPKFLRHRDVLSAIAIALLFYVLQMPATTAKLIGLSSSFGNENGLSTIGRIVAGLVVCLLVFLILKLLGRIDKSE
jgi:hypothetical protein